MASAGVYGQFSEENGLAMGLPWRFDGRSLREYAKPAYSEGKRCFAGIYTVARDTPGLRERAELKSLSTVVRFARDIDSV